MRQPDFRLLRRDSSPNNLNMHGKSQNALLPRAWRGWRGGRGQLGLLSKGLRLVKLSVRLVGTINYKNANFNVNRTKYFDQLPKMNFGTCLPVHVAEGSIVI